MITLPGWTIETNEISKGVLKVNLQNASSRKIEIVDAATEETIQKALSYAFDLEKHMSKNWNKFLYDLFFAAVRGLDKNDEEYNDQAFGSWFIEFVDQRVVFDGKEGELIFEIKKNCGWHCETSLSKAELTYFQLETLIAKIVKP